MFRLVGINEGLSKYERDIEDNVEDEALRRTSTRVIEGAQFKRR